MMKSKRPFRLYSYFNQHKQACIPCWKQLANSPLASLTTILVIGLAWALPAIFLVILDNLQHMTHGWKKSTQISIYLKTQMTEKELTDTLQKLRTNPAISKVEYISPQSGLEMFIKHSAFKHTLNHLNQNPLPPVLAIQPAFQEPEQIRQLADEFTQLAQAEYVRIDMEWLERFNSIINLAKRMTYWLACLFSFGVLLIVAHTVHLATQEQRRDIQVYQLVGATGSFIRRPFLYMGVMYGVLGAIVALGLVDSLLLFLKNPTQKLASLYQSQFELQRLSLTQMLFLFFISISLSWAASWIGVHQDQKV